ncbi:MAG: Uma2 family endonuclease [Bacteroidota bacterium]
MLTLAPPTLRRFTVEEYHAMAEAGVLSRDVRTELIDGLILEMSPFSPPHVAVVNRLNRMLIQALGEAAVVSVQNSVRLDDGTEPEPDLAVLRSDTPETRIPEARDALLVVEVSESTEAYDRGIKMARYAAAGIPEAWIILPTQRRAEIYRQPGPAEYAEMRVLDRDGDLSILMLPEAPSLRLVDALPAETDD